MSELRPLDLINSYDRKTGSLVNTVSAPIDTLGSDAGCCSALLKESTDAVWNDLIKTQEK